MENEIKLEENRRREALIKEMHRGGRKRSLAWAYQGISFPVVHKKSGEVASEEYLQTILLYYASMRTYGVHSDADFLAEELVDSEFADYIKEFYSRWIAAGAEAKKRFVVYVAAIYGGVEIIDELQYQIQEWVKASRGAMACEAVRALALSPLPQALLVVDGMTRKFQSKQVKKAARQAMDFAAERFGLTREELEDKIVPDFGFYQNNKRVFEYGSRKFTVSLTVTLGIEVYNEKGKKVKSLPIPGKRDEPEKAERAYREFQQLKKQIKLVGNSQKIRMEQALFCGREWSIEGWMELFIKNPLMRQFAIGLIWGVYKEEKLQQSFRYMEDGSLNTAKEEEFRLPIEGKEERIQLVHPLELEEEERTAWREQLADYEIIQPIEQIERAVFRKEEAELEQENLERFVGVVVEKQRFIRKLLGMGWCQRDCIIEEQLISFYREDFAYQMGVEIFTSGGTYREGVEEITLYKVQFYPARTRGSRGSSSIMYVGMQGEIQMVDSYKISDVHKRYFSEIVRQITLAVRR